MYLGSETCVSAAAGVMGAHPGERLARPEMSGAEGSGFGFCAVDRGRGLCSEKWGEEERPNLLDLQRDQAPHGALLGWHGFPLKETLDLQRHIFRCHAEGEYVADIYQVVARSTATYSAVHRMAPQHPPPKIG